MGHICIAALSKHGKVSHRRLRYVVEQRLVPGLRAGRQGRSLMLSEPAALAVLVAGALLESGLSSRRIRGIMRAAGSRGLRLNALGQNRSWTLVRLHESMFLTLNFERLCAAVQAASKEQQE